MDTQQDGEGLLNSVYMTEQNPAYHYSLTNDEKQWLKIIMVQRFLRDQGCEIDFSFNAALARMVDSLAQDCRDRGFYKDSVDVRFTLTDICINRGFSYTTFEMVRLAEELEGKS